MRTGERWLGGWAATVVVAALVGCHSSTGGRPGTDGSASADTASASGDASPDQAGGSADATSQGGGGGAGGGGASSSAGGSGAAGNGGTAGITGGGGNTTCGGRSFDQAPAPVDLFVVLDRSASMADGADGQLPTAGNPSKWNEVTQALTEVIGAGGDAFAWGMKAFPEEGAFACAATTVTTRIDVPVATGNTGSVINAIAALAPTGNGTPTSAAIRVATDYLRALADGRPKYLLLVTDGEPGCSGSAGALVPDTVGARTDAINALTGAAQAGLRTFVVGVATTSASASATLNAMAAAGLEARREPNPLALRYYRASTEAELVAALRTITGAVGTCSFPLAEPPPVPGAVSVTVGGAAAPHDPSRTDGWEYGIGGSGLDTIQVYGSWCDMVRSPAAPRVSIVFGCPSGDGGVDARGDAAPAGAGTVLMLDDFEDGMADGWIPVSSPIPPSVWSVVADGANHAFAQADATLGSALVVGGDIAWTDQAVEARVKFLTTPNQAQVMARFLDPTTYYIAELSLTGRMKIRKRSVNGTFELASAAGPAPLAIDTWYTIGLTVQGATLTAYLNGTALVTTTDTTLPTIDAGGIGLGTAVTAAMFDDVKVTIP